MPLPVLGAVARFLASRGAREAIKKYGSKAVEAAKKEISKRDTAMDKMAKKANLGADRSTTLGAKSTRASDSGHWGSMSGRAERLSKADKRARPESDLLRPPKDEAALKFEHGGKVRGAGKATKGVRPCKMR